MRKAELIESGSSSSQSIGAKDICAFCGSTEVRAHFVTRSFGKGADLLVIEAIPLWSCPSCNESYFTAQTMHEIERIKALRKSVAVRRKVAVAVFEPASA